jgi:hypothetical protein
MLAAYNFTQRPRHRGLVQWFGSDAIEMTYKDAAGKVGN